MSPFPPTATWRPAPSCASIAVAKKDQTPASAPNTSPREQAVRAARTTWCVRWNARRATASRWAKWPSVKSRPCGWCSPAWRRGIVSASTSRLPLGTPTAPRLRWTLRWAMPKSRRRRRLPCRSMMPSRRPRGCRAMPASRRSTCCWQRRNRASQPSHGGWWTMSFEPSASRRRLFVRAPSGTHGRRRTTARTASALRRMGRPTSPIMRYRQTSPITCSSICSRFARTPRWPPWRA